MPKAHGVAIATAVFCLLALAPLAQAQDPKPAPPAANPPAAKPPENPPEKVPEKPADPDEFTLVPQSIQTSAYITFDPSGKIQGENSNLGLYVNLQYHGKAIPLAIRNLQIAHAATDAGDHLQYNSNGAAELRLRDWAQPQMARNDLQFSLSFTGVPPRARLLTEITGSFDFVYTNGPLQEAILKPISDFLDKRVRFKGVPKGWITIARAGDKQLRVVYDADMRSMIDQIVFLDDDGRALPVNNWSSGNDQAGGEYRQFTMPMPDKGGVIIRLYSTILTRSVPFRIANLPLVPADAAQPVQDVVIDTHPVTGGMVGLPIQKIDPIIIDDK